MTRRRVLLVAEAVTLAHVVRLVSIGRSLDPDRHEVLLAADPRYASAVGPVGFPSREIRSMPASTFYRALATGSPIFDEATLRRYVADELQLINEFKPDAVIGDFRISLAISARIARVPFINLTNAYWSPYATIRHVLPEITIARLLGTRIGQSLFSFFRPVGYAAHVRPVNAVRRHYGLPALPHDFRYALVDGDLTCYADVAEIIPTRPLPASHSFVGPIPWSPDVSLPDWWSRLEARARELPVAYVTLGSSGPPSALAKVLTALEDLPIMVVASTAGRGSDVPRTRNALLAEFLPGDVAARMSTVVICNGGSPTSYQALSAGKPVIGVATNMDQFLNMAAIEDAGCGILLRSGSFDGNAVRSSVQRALEDSRLKERASHIEASIARHHWAPTLTQTLERALAP